MTDSQSDLTQTQTQDGDWFSSQENRDIGEPRKPWGRITPRKIMIKRLGNQSVTLQESLSASFDLYNDSFIIGRDQKCQWTITAQDVPPKFWDRISKEHCKITKDLSDATNPVFIEDLSRNGTFLNGELIGIYEKRILKSDDVVSFNEPGNKIFHFDNSYQESYGVPEDIFQLYHIGRQLGSGAQGLVRLVIERKTCQTFAMKSVQKNGSANTLGSVNDERIHREVDIMRSLNHRNIIRCYDIIMKPNAVYMFLQFMEGGDLLHRIQREKYLTVDTSKFYFQQLCQAVKYLHDQNITHRDIKPDNILLLNNEDRTNLKLSDFGLSKLLQENSLLQTMCGTPLYVSPEILVTAGRGTYTNKVDIWSLGVVLYAMLSGHLPFCNEGNTVAQTLIKSGKFNFDKERFNYVPETAKELIRQMLTVNPVNRPSIDDVLMHPWLKDEEKHFFDNDFLLSILYTDEEMRQPPAKRRRIE
ncbi:Ovarian-specific serine/threonine-protein kinase Lok [Pseudolycoriella hygida]|uniref:Ovarian-specific serine/threonine-protein kinase Lok n=1 Tax=Pseudolycoriella hygida TaxID=35572 RepID=A0A9Q0NGD1_9DIPT|nr:Ovarian-specific serine/threonine-protein kinase Lok [Pseudolycoriella hygida]